MDRFDKEAVKDRDVHRYGYSSARGLTLAEARNHPNRNGEQHREWWIASVLIRAGRGVYLVPPRWTEGGAPPISSLPGRALRWGCRSDPGLMASLPSKSGL